jgi:hypothetical protein
VAQVNLDVVYNVKGMQALKQSQVAMNQAAAAANGGANNIRKYNSALTANGAAATKSATANAAASKGFRATGFAATSASGGVNSFGIALSAALGPIAAITGGLALISKTIGIFSDRQRDVAVLRNGLQNLGQAGTSALDALQASADKLGKTTLFDEEDFTRGYALLTSFKQIGVDSYERVAKAASDMSTIIGSDLNSSLLQLSKALEDPARGLTYLSRSGTTFEEHQIELIKTLQASGNILGAQAEILNVVEGQYADAAEAAGSAGFAGSMDSAGEAARDLGEAVGKIIVPALENFLKTITPIIDKLAKFINLVAEIPGVLSGIEGATGGLASMFDKPKEDAKDLKKTLEETPEPIDKSAQLVETLTKNLAAAKAKSASFETTQNAALRNANTLAQARLTAEKQMLGVQKEKAQMELEAAKTEQEKMAAIEAIYQATVAQAKLEYEETKLTLQAQVKKLEVARDLLELKVKEAQIEVGLAKARKEDAKAAMQAVQVAMEGLAIAKSQIVTQKAANEELLKAAAAVRDQKIAAAGVLKEQQLQELQQQKTNQEIDKGVQKMGQLASAANSAAAATQGVANAAAAAGGGGGGGKSTTSVWHGDQVYDKYKLDDAGNIVRTSEEEQRRQMNAAHLGMLNAQANREQVDDFMKNFDWQRFKESGGKDRGVYFPKGNGGSRGGSTASAFATGGYVTQATEAVVGEGGEPEYIIPESKMAGAMRRYGSGVRGNSVIPDSGVTINYSGSTVNFNGDDYIKRSDVGGIVKSATNATMNTLTRSSGARLGAGL